MNGFLPDTNCISELVRLQPDPRAVAWMEAAEESTLYFSVLTLGEIRTGLAGLPPGKRRTRIELWLEVDLPARFSGRILPIDLAVAYRWGMLAAQAKTKGVALPILDGLLAATAIRHGLTMVSRNARDFASALVPVVNPWET